MAEVRIRSGLKEVAKARGLSLRQIAEDIGMKNSWESVRRFANDETTRYSRDLLEKIISRYNCQLDELLIVEKIKD